MADRKISDLTALTTPASGDFLPIVDISEAAAASKNKRITIEELMRGMPDGTAAAPGIAFETDPNTGIYSPGADQLAVATNGTGRLFVDATGNVGVGTASPTSFGAGAVMQSIVGTTGYGGYLGFTNNVTVQLWADEGGGTGQMGTRTNHPLIATVNNTERLRVTSAGLVGIGTSSPAYQLHVSSGSASDIQTATENSAGLSRYGTRGSGNAFAGSFTAGKSFELWSAGTQAVTIDSSQRVGIGTTSPGALLDVNADTVRVRTARTPASATATGATGEICWDANYIYVAVGTNTWKRAALSTW